MLGTEVKNLLMKFSYMHYARKNVIVSSASLNLSMGNEIEWNMMCRSGESAKQKKYLREALKCGPRCMCLGAKL